jgi:hypothetical protein
MLRHIKRLTWLAALVAGGLSAEAFSLFGPFNEAYQVRDLGYNINERGDQGAPKNINEEYRRNIPTVYYSFDQNFLEFYGAYGASQVDKAFSILNSLTNVSYYSDDLSEFPLESRRQNYRAAALNLIDLKSETLSIMVEQLGLADPLRYVWCLHDRTAGAACPIGNEYLVTMRNFGVTPGNLNQYVYSPYVNGVLYTYYINEFCANPPFGFGLSETAILPVDLHQVDRYLPVASTGAGFYLGGLGIGGFFTGLTRDDVAGLRYLMRAGNANWESNPSGALAFVTNNAPQSLSLLVTSNLTDLVSASLTNTDAGLVAQFPGLVISSSIPAFTNVVTSNLVAYYTNFPWAPAGIFTLVVTNQLDTNVALIYQRTFANLVTNFLYLPTGYVFTNNNVFTNGQPVTSGTVTVIETNIGPVASTDPYGQPGLTTIVTNVTISTMTTNMLVGDYFIVPTNSCDFLFLSNVLTKTYSVTNTVVASNNAATPPPSGGITASNAFQFFSRTYITYWTNHNFAYFPVTCTTNLPGLRRGVEKINFVRRDYDSLFGQYWYPVTNLFTLTTVTNSKDSPTVFQRVVTQPDFLFTARDMAPGPAGDPRNWFDVGTSMAFATNNALPNLAGPGTIESPTVITFNRSGPMFWNISTNNDWRLDDLMKLALPTWGSFDDSTNAPVVYPNSLSLAMLESMMLLTLTPTSVDAARVGDPYYFQFSGHGGQAPYTITLSPDSPGLPPGLGLAADGSGALFGTPALGGIYDFILRLSDANGRFSDWQLTITITE